jgi:hypothetical protein
MKKYAKVVDVPVIEQHEKAYNHHRPISSLLMHQLRHLQLAEQSLPEKDRSKVNVNQLHTELEASKYIQVVMRKLHPREKQKKSKRAGKSRRRIGTRKKRLSRRHR